MPWDSATIEKYHSYAQTYISTYAEKIDCADLAIASLVDFTGQNSRRGTLTFSPARAAGAFPSKL